MYRFILSHGMYITDPNPLFRGIAFTGASWLFTSRISGLGYKNCPVHLCVCLSACLFVIVLMAELFDIWSQNLVQGLTLMISWTSLMVKAMGQRSRSPGQKRHFQGFLIWVNRYQTPGHGVTSSHVMAWRDEIMWCHRMMSAFITASGPPEVH